MDLTNFHPTSAAIITAAIALGAVVTSKQVDSCYTSQCSYSTCKGVAITLVSCKWPAGADYRPTGPELWKLFDALNIQDRWLSRRENENKLQELQIFDSPFLATKGQRGDGIAIAIPVVHVWSSSQGTTRCPHIYMDEKGEMQTALFG